MHLQSVLSGCSAEAQALFGYANRSDEEDPFDALRFATLGMSLETVEYPSVARRAWERLGPLTTDPEGKLWVPRIYLDSTASTLTSRHVEETRTLVMRRYGNSHTTNHRGARVITEALEAVHEMVLRFVGADPETHTVVFLGSGATEAINRIAEILEKENSRRRIFGSEMEHHANHLPWLRRFPSHYMVVPIDPDTGRLRVDKLAEWLRSAKGNVRLVTVTGVSNVTGIVNDLTEIARLTHEAGAELFVDGAQMVAHLPTRMEETGIDGYAFSSHKIYVPGGPGVLVLPKKLAEIMVKFGGGMVLSVNTDRFIPAINLADRQSPGTPNIPGILQLGSSLLSLDSIGMDQVWEHEQALTRLLVEGLVQMGGAITVYGDTNLARTPRAGVVSFNVAGIHHDPVAAALDAFFNIAVRNGCFCAHPYVKSLLKFTPEQNAAFERAVQADTRGPLPGMVRASLGVYSNEEDVRRFLAAIRLMLEDVGFSGIVRSLVPSNELCESPA